LIVAENLTLPFDGMLFNISFSPATVYSENGLLGPAVAGDMDGDGLDDLMMFRHGSGTYELLRLQNEGDLGFTLPEIAFQVPRPEGTLVAVPLEISLAPQAGTAPDVIVFERHWSPNGGGPQQRDQQAVVRRFSLQPDDTFTASAEWRVRDARPFESELRVVIADDWTGDGRTDVVWIKGSRVRAFVYTDAADVPVLESATHSRNAPVTARQRIRVNYQLSDPASSLSSTPHNWIAVYSLDINGNGEVDGGDYALRAGVDIFINGWGVVLDRLIVRNRWPKGTFNVLIELRNETTDATLTGLLDRPLTIV
jgi:hypothetical protein